MPPQTKHTVAELLDVIRGNPELKTYREVSEHLGCGLQSQSVYITMRKSSHWRAVKRLFRMRRRRHTRNGHLQTMRVSKSLRMFGATLEDLGAEVMNGVSREWVRQLLQEDGGVERGRITGDLGLILRSLRHDPSIDSWRKLSLSIGVRGTKKAQDEIRCTLRNFGFLESTERLFRYRKHLIKSARVRARQAQIISRVKLLADKLDRTPTIRELKSIQIPQSNITTLFGWKSAAHFWRDCGLTPNPRGGDRSKIKNPHNE